MKDSKDRYDVSLTIPDQSPPPEKLDGMFEIWADLFRMLRDAVASGRNLDQTEICESLGIYRDCLVQGLLELSHRGLIHMTLEVD